jgi:glycosyltransferase involved in cell wall biosynthesis
MQCLLFLEKAEKGNIQEEHNLIQHLPLFRLTVHLLIHQPSQPYRGNLQEKLISMKTTSPAGDRIEVDVVTVDIIVPVHNAVSTIEECLQSVLNQRFPTETEQAIIREDDIDDNKGNSKNGHGYFKFALHMTLCCHDDGSTDESLENMRAIKTKWEERESSRTEINTDTAREYKKGTVTTKLIIGSSKESSGAGVARNCAIKLSAGTYLAMLDSDDIMMPTRIVEQVAYMRCLSSVEERNRTLLGCAFRRDPPDSTWHYAQWANALTDERRMLERFREVTVIQPTWMMTRFRFEKLGGYLDPSKMLLDTTDLEECDNKEKSPPRRANTDGVSYYDLVCKSDNANSLRLAEDLRLFHAHLVYNSDEIVRKLKDYPSVLHGDGLVKLLPSRSKKDHNDEQNKQNDIELSDTNNNNATCGSIRKDNASSSDDKAKQSPSPSTPSISLLHQQPSPRPLVIYRHVPGQSQSSWTPRKLLLQLRTKAFEDLVLTKNPLWQKDGFVIWGAGRDGKAFFRALSEEARQLVKCFVDVDENKLRIGNYYNRELRANVPVRHFSVLAPHGNDNSSEENGDSNGNADNHHTVKEYFGHIDKKRRRSDDDTTPASAQENVASLIALPSRDVVVVKHDTNNKAKTKVDDIDQLLLTSLPVVVCVAMYRTSGALEKNVATIGRTEGVDLWHFS